MKLPAKQLLLLVVSALQCLRADADSVAGTDIGLLRLTTTNLDGRGVRVAQVEDGIDGNTNAWMVAPANAGQPVGLFTFLSALGTANTYPNSVGVNSWHADAVGQFFYGNPAGMATNVAHVDNFERNFFVNKYVISNLVALNDPVVSQSFAYGGLDATADLLFDNYAAQTRTLFVSAVDNGGGIHSPASCYNGIGVAAYGTIYSSIGPTSDNGRCKPDITATAYVTSYSTPQVAGAAALLYQAGQRGDAGTDTNSACDPRTLKALLLNGAVKPADWTNGSSTPLDARYGAGKANVLNSYRQLIGGKRSCIVSNFVAQGGLHYPTGATGTVAVLNGWDYSTNTSDLVTPRDAVNHYYFNLTNSPDNFMGTATLVWHKHAGATNINNLDLFLYNCANSNLIACSTSRVDNVEHIFMPQLAPGRYDLQVWKSGATNAVSAAEPYGLAFEFVNVRLALNKAGNTATLQWPLYPAGFIAEANTNVNATSNWSASSLPAPTYINGSNQVQFLPASPVQWFRLHQP